MTTTTLLVSAIKEGTVIDHLIPGQALKVIRMLHLENQQTPITIGLNLKSRSKGFKDLIKFEQLFLTEKHCACIAIFSPGATVNVIQDYKVAQKITVAIPHVIDHLLRCPNLSCVTRHENIPTRFLVEKNNSLVLLHCRHCEKGFSADEMNH